MKNKKLIVIILLVILVFISILSTAYIVFTQKEKISVLFNIDKKCEYNNDLFKNGEHFDAEDECNKCICSNGVVICTDARCEEFSNYERMNDEKKDGDTDVNNTSFTDNSDNFSFEGWKTFEDNTSGLRFKYPSDFNVETREDNVISISSKNGAYIISVFFDTSILDLYKESTYFSEVGNVKDVYYNIGGKEFKSNHFFFGEGIPVVCNHEPLANSGFNTVYQDIDVIEINSKVVVVISVANNEYYDCDKKEVIKTFVTEEELIMGEKLLQSMEVSD